MPKEGWRSLSVPTPFIDELKAELKKDKVFKSMGSLVVHVMRRYFHNKNSEDVLGDLLDKVSFIIMYVDQIVQPPLGRRLDSQKINLEAWQKIKETGIPFWKALVELKNLEVVKKRYVAVYYNTKEKVKA